MYLGGKQIKKGTREMNANELADELDTTGRLHNWAKKAQAMLRQQQEKIIKLETALQGWEIGFERMGYERLLKDKEEYITALLKEPTEEEILSCWDGVDPPEECWITDEHRILFARAILRKAHEK